MKKNEGYWERLGAHCNTVSEMDRSLGERRSISMILFLETGWFEFGILPSLSTGGSL